MGNDQSVSRKTFPGETSKKLDKVRIELADCAFANGSEASVDLLVSNAATYGSSLYWCNAVVGCKRYIYFEQCYDGRGLKF